MTNETIKVLLTVILLGGLRAAIFVSEMQKSQFRMYYHDLLDWMMPPVWPTKSHERHA
jgi:hypothetical protein